MTVTRDGIGEQMSEIPQGPFVGRVAECRVLDELTDLVTRGYSGSVVFLGEPGVGKTRLLQHLDTHSSRIRVTRLVGIESELRLGFAGLHRLLAPLHDDFARLPAPQRDALLTTFGVLDHNPPPRFLIGLAALGLLAREAERTPLVCVIDDAQWLDQESLDVLGFVARRAYADALGFVFAGRENQDSLGALSGLPTRHLAGLDHDASSLLISTARCAAPSPLVAARIVAETDGNPLAMLELVDRLTSDQLAGRLPLPPQLPAGGGLNAHFLRQWETLPVETRSLLLLASAMSTDDVSVFWGAAALLGLPGEAVDAAEQLDLLSLSDTVAFRHPLIRSAVYAAAEPQQRRLAHTALATIAEHDGDPDLAAWHRAAATTAPDEEVAADLERSAERAERRGGQVAQARFLGRAADLSPAARDRSLRLFASARAYLASGDGILAEALLDRAAPALDADGRHVDVERLRASIAVFFSRHKDVPAILLGAVASLDPDDHATARDMLFDALQAALVARDHTVGMTPTDIARATLAHPFPTGPAASGRDLLLHGLATRLAIGYEPAVPLLQRSVRALFADERVGVGALSTIILGWFAADDVWDDEGRAAMFERALAVAREHGVLGALRVILAGRCVGQCWTGAIDDAEQSYFEAAEISALIGVPPPATTGVLLEVRAWQGRERESREMAESTASWGRQQGAEILEVFSWFGLTVLEMGLGNYGEALTSAREIYDRDPPGFGNRILPELVEAAARTGQVEMAEAALRRLSDRARASGTPWAMGMLARSTAILADDSEAAALFEEAIDRLLPTSVRTELARSHLLYGEWLRRRRRRSDAQVHLSTAWQMFEAMGATAFAGRARNELLAAGQRPIAAVDGRADFGLTAQEAQVARLASGGATNAEIAARMFLTTSTVEYHLGKVFRKLSITSRRQLGRAFSS
ncbi:AAA family ATPase [Herbiconiux sp. CPCC 205763]|uniref:AAA family ATPase n=1 Tax=Herbiconiux aconitum TaxID=2970913 RepID=A0ABT2GNJ7_9MICO|nr:LuxR family transcriptional regulator [Herbiconiux aconitum]MCS5717800.1 AAA family ATPase [Herbiconiux aconitum]